MMITMMITTCDDNHDDTDTIIIDDIDDITISKISWIFRFFGFEEMIEEILLITNNKELLSCLLIIVSFYS